LLDLRTPPETRFTLVYGNPKFGTITSDESRETLDGEENRPVATQESRVGPALFLIFVGGALAYNLIENRQRDLDSRSSPTLTLSRDEAIENHWEDIREYFSGTEDVDACSVDNGNCYSLQADIVGGYLDTIYFSNGGSLSFFTEIDEFGNALELDENGHLWDFTIDMNSSTVEGAVEEWAGVNGYTVE
jgi:hypothetical protein